MSDEQLQKRKENFFKFLKNNTNKVSLVILGFILWITAWIRTRNIPLMNGKYIPDVDSYYFLRLSKYVIEHGSLFTIDMMRNVPLGVDISKDLVALPYVLAYIYKFFSFFIPTFTAENAAMIYPVLFFIISGIFFYFFIKNVFDEKVALLSTAIFATVPAFLYRTLAGVADKEPLGMALLFITFYFYVKALYTKTNKRRIIYSTLSGVATGFLGLAWGGVQFIIGTMAVYHLFEFVLGRFNKDRYYTYVPWWLSVVLILTQLTNRYGDLSLFFTSALFGSTTLVLFLAVTNSILSSDRWKFTKKLKEKYPTNILSIVIGSLAGVIFSSLLFGFSFIPNQAEAVYRKLTGIGFTRWLTTVAENRQTYFVDWFGQFGGKLYTWLFLIGAVVLFYHTFKHLDKYKWRLTGFFTLFLAGFTLNKYSTISVFNGTSPTALTAFFGSILVFGLALIYYYTKMFYKDKESLAKLKDINPGYLFVVVWFLINIIAAKLGIRFIFVLAPATAVTIAFTMVKAYDRSFKFKKLIFKIIVWAILIFILYTTVYKFAISDYQTATYAGPSFHGQWQTGMEWVKNNTPEDAVFAHWWDYGYWVQEGGERATILDGGNFIVWWNHLMGRHVLTGHSSREALEFLKVHDTTHLLIVSDEIGKYGAYSLIGSDEELDRFATLGVFGIDYSQLQETRNGTYYLYRGGIGLDENIYYQGQLLPKGSAAIGGVVLRIDETGNGSSIFGQPTVGIIYRGQQYNVPLGCVWFNGQRFDFPQNDYDGCLVIIPQVANGRVDPIGAGIFLSQKVEKTLFAHMYLMDEEWEGFKLVYSDKDSVPLAVYNGRLIGPMKIWEIDYPRSLENYENPDYLSKTFVNEALI